MTRTLEPPQPARRGRPAVPIRCVKTAAVFPSAREAAAWLSAAGTPIHPHTIYNAARDGRACRGYTWEAARPETHPGRPVVCPDTGECHPDADAAARAMSRAGWGAVTADRIVAAVLSGGLLCGRWWDWRGRGWHYCHAEQAAGERCPACTARVSAPAIPA